MSFGPDTLGTRWETALGRDPMIDLGISSSLRVGPFRGDFFRRHNDENYPTSLAVPPAESYLRRPFSNKEDILALQANRRFAREQTPVLPLLQEITDFYLTLCHPFRSMATSAAITGGLDQLEKIMYEDLSEFITDWPPLKDRLTSAQNLSGIPPLLKAALAQTLSSFEAAMRVIASVQLLADRRTWSERLTSSEAKPRIRFGEAPDSVTAKLAIEKALGKALGVTIERSATKGIFEGEACAFAFLEFLHTSASFESRLAGFMTDPVFSSEGALELEGLHHAHFLHSAVKEGGASSSAPQDSLVLRPEQKVLVFVGPNNAGKSHLFGALGQSVLMAHAGLGVTASRAVLPLSTGLLTHQPRPTQGSRVGKFETEVGHLATLRDSTKPRHWVFLDEMLAGAAPRESVTGVAENVIASIVKRGGRVVLVTHDLNLVDRLSKDSSTAVYLSGQNAASRQFAPAAEDALAEMTTGYDATVRDIAVKHGF